MNRSVVIFFFSTAFLVGVTFCGCGKTGPVDATTGDGRINITNDEGTLEGGMNYSDTSDVLIDTTKAPNGQLRKLSHVASSITLKLRATRNPIKYKGSTLQATHVTINGDYAFVSYNTQGDVYLGGVDVIDISKPEKPKLISSGTFDGTDVSALWYDNDKLYLAEATEDTGFTYPATIEVLSLSGKKLTHSSNRIGVSSYVATDVKVSNGKIWVTSGSGGPGTGGLTILDASSLSLIAEDLFLDARSVDVDGSTAYALQGGPARLRTYNTVTNAVIDSFNVGGANIAESKSVVDVVLDRAFVAAGDEGVKVFSTTSNSVIDQLPAVTVSGLSSTVTVTNAVSVSKDYLFAANGEAGVYVAQAQFDMESQSGSDPQLQYIGSLIFNSQESANFVASSDHMLFVATGTGGLKIVEIQ